MKTVQIFDPALCCRTGVCGADVDQELVTAAANVEWAQRNGAHIERFNRTVQEECLGNRLTYKTPNTKIQARLTAYLDYYNHERVHLGLRLRKPIEMLQSS